MLKLFINSLQELVFPSYCLQCKQRLPCRELPLLCNDCLAKVNSISTPKCICCGTPFLTGQDHLCGLCLKRTFAFDLARSSLRYREPIAPLISSIKFKNSLTGLTTLSNLARNTPGIKDLSIPDIILPVPLHIKRLRERKFNQAISISHACFPELKHLINPDILHRHRMTSPQTGLTGRERRKNLASAFSLKKPELVKNKNLLIVDDVFTTGSTVNECAKILRKAEAKRIEVFTLARAI